MCAAGIYGKVMVDSCSGNGDNKREQQRVAKEEEEEKKKKNPTAGSAQGVMAPALRTTSSWQQAAGRNGCVNIHSERQHMSINL